MDVSRTAGKQQSGEDLLDEGSRLREDERRSLVGAPPFALHKRVGDRTDRQVVLPAGLRASFEMVEPQFGCEVLVTLFDRPAVMR